jgi:hypothetical protein
MASKKCRPGDAQSKTTRASSLSAKLLASSAAVLADFAAQALAAADNLRITTKPLDRFWLAPAQREVLRRLSGLPQSTQRKLAKDGSRFTVAQMVGMAQALAEALPHYGTSRSVPALMVAAHLMERLKEVIVNPAALPRRRGRKPQAAGRVDAVLQFKITLKDSQPPIWRRIQVQDCTLDRFHEHIQTAMGWTNSHLHQFEIKGQRYGDPELLDDGFDDFECEDSTTTMVSAILPKTGKRFAFKYEYDFGDSWEHEVLFEGSPTTDPKAKYPLCVEGERACPPEDCGGIWGYGEFLEAIRSPKYEEHDSMLEWVGGGFDPEKFDPKRATKAMKKGLPDWRSMR